VQTLYSLLSPFLPPQIKVSFAQGKEKKAFGERANGLFLPWEVAFPLSRLAFPAFNLQFRAVKTSHTLAGKGLFRRGRG